MNCTICDKQSIEMERVMKSAQKKDMCFKCGHWTDILQEYWIGAARDDGAIACVIECHHYVFTPGIFGPDKDCGMGGTLYKMTVNGTEYETNNLWHQGEIPAHFRDELPDNATRQAIPRHSRKI